MKQSRKVQITVATHNGTMIISIEIIIFFISILKQQNIIKLHEINFFEK